MITHENTLSERERFTLMALASDSDPATSKRARALIEWSQGESGDQVAESTGLKVSQVRSLTRAFSQKRLEVFSPSSIERAGRGFAGSTTVDELIQKNNVDLSHARYVANTALRIFDATVQVHQLTLEWRRILETGALLHNLGMETDDDHRHRAGREIILAHDLEGFSPRERDILALLVSYHRKKVKATRDPIFSEFDEPTQQATLALAAVLRVADGLDFSRSQSTIIDSLTVNSVVDTIVEGPQAEEDATRADKNADLWRQVLTPPFYARVVGQELPAPGQRRSPPKATVKSHEPITKAGKKIISAQFAKVSSLERDVRGGDGVEAVHDMRVATRRMRSALRMLKSYYSKKTAKKIRGPLTDLAQGLGAVRDLDVLIENLRSYCAQLTAEQAKSLDPLIADWQARRAQAQRKLVQFMDSRDYENWLARMEDFVEARDKSRAPRVSDVMPAKIWSRYGKVREYETRLKEPTLEELHALRIECKRLRYALEFFADTMGAETPVILEPLIALQDYLGELHDADMAAQLVGEFIAARARYDQRQGESSSFEGVATYLLFLQNRMKDLQAGYPKRWTILIRSPYRRALADAVAAM